jgi:uncharacterized iron-regulated membrane protein
MSAVSGSLLRRILFWGHLCSGVGAGLVILVLCVTGTLLTYEKQMLAAAERGNRVAAPPAAPPLGAERLAAIARAAAPEQRRLALLFDVDPLAPVMVPRGREAALLLNPYTGEALPDRAAGMRGFMRTMENWHRWLGGTGSSARASAVDVANLLFFLMVLSGIYLWLPAVWRWRTVRGLMLFNARNVNAKVRDFNWHHVFSFWMVVPLLLISLSGVVMSFGWANQLLFALYGEQPVQRRGAEGGAAAAAPRGAAARADLDALLAAARAQIPGWRRLTLPVGGAAPTVEIGADLEPQGARAQRYTLVLDATDASVVRRTPPAVTQSPGQRARSWIRFVHTGEQYGVPGQTLAGLASLAACFLVYTGLALAYRRLILGS